MILAWVRKRPMETRNLLRIIVVLLAIIAFGLPALIGAALGFVSLSKIWAALRGRAVDSRNAKLVAELDQTERVDWANREGGPFANCRWRST